MKKKKTIKLLSIAFVCLLYFSLLFVSKNTYASDSSHNLTLHEMSKIYSSSNNDYFTGCENFSKYRSVSPGITILTHGLGGLACNWSNSGQWELGNNESSLIRKISKINNNEVDIYVAECSKESQYDFNLLKYNIDLSSFTTIKRINDTSKHIILLFQSGNGMESNDYIYEEFENVIDTISLQYKSLCGMLPRLNLVGHSRGGLTNIQYATEHPYNVVGMYSMGTPYNGSALGNCDKMLDLLDMNNPKTGQYFPGVLSIMDYEESERIRDNWNNAYKPDVQIHVVALGSVTALSYIKKFLVDAKPYMESLIMKQSSDSLTLEQCSDMLDEYIDMANKLLTLVNYLPNTTGLILDFFESYANAASFFQTNAYEELIQQIYPSFSGSITVEEGNRIIELYNVLNGEPVLMDDLFIDLNSQLGLFENNNNYNGFNRYIKVFEPEDINGNRSQPNEPAVVHNMEAMNDDYTNFISNDLDYGYSKTQTTKISELGSYDGSFIGEKILEFNCIASGKRIITSDSPFKVYEKNGLEIYVNNNIVELEANRTYYFVLNHTCSKSSSFSFTVYNKFEKSSNFKGNESKIFHISNISKGFYNLPRSNSNIKFYNLEDQEISYIYNDGSSTNYIIVKNNTSHCISGFELALSAISNINPSNETKYYSSQTLVCLANKNDYAVNYDIIIPNETTVTIYNLNNQTKSLSIVYSNDITYNLCLEKNEVVYIKFNQNCNATIKLDESQFYWFLDGKIITESKIEVYPKTTYSLVLKSKDNNTQQYNSVPSDYTMSSNANNYLSLVGSKLSVSSDALIGDKYTICHTLYSENMLDICIVPKKDFTISITNSDSIKIKWTKSTSSSQISEVKLKIINLSSTTDKPLYIYTNNNEYTLTSYEMTKLFLNCTIKIDNVKFKNGNVEYSYNGSYFTNSESFNGFYGGGSGTEDSPYLIGCERHLINISKSNRNYYELISNVNISNWSPIIFYGTLNGNYYKINYIDINCTKNERYGLFSSNYGEIKNLKVCYPTITSTLIKSGAYGGSIAGYNSGLIENCYVSGAIFNVKTANASFGGIVGYNSGIIRNCSCCSLTMTGSGNCGSICGVNTGTIDSCYVSGANITYVTIIETEKGKSTTTYYYNGNVGGACGCNTGSISNTDVTGYITWNESSNNKAICPNIGKMVGKNSGKIVDSWSGFGYSIQYYYFNFIVVYNQSNHCFKEMNGYIGYQK